MNRCVLCGRKMRKFFQFFLCLHCGLQFDGKKCECRKLSKTYDSAGEVESLEWIKLADGCLLVIEEEPV